MGSLNVLLTGGSSGIGRATALMLSKDGHNVVVTGRNKTKLAETERLAKESGGKKVTAVIGEVGVEEDVVRNYGEAISALGGHIDVAVLNAGIAMPATKLEDHTAQVYDELFNTNVRGVFLWLKAVLPDFKKRGSGQIIIVNSTCGREILTSLASVYHASKYAVTGLARALRLELQGTGIKVATVFPDITDTDITTTPAFKGNDLKKALAACGIPYIFLSSEDVASTILTIAYQSPRSDIEEIAIKPKPVTPRK